MMDQRVMAVGLGILADVESKAVLAFAGANILAIVFMAKHATDSYLTRLINKDDYISMAMHEEAQTPRVTYQEVRIRLASFWFVAIIVLVAVVLKLVLQRDLADQIIAAWFIGQGFALQPYVQSYLTGITSRSNAQIRKHIFEKDMMIEYADEKWTCSAHDLLSMTLKHETATRVVPWTEVGKMKFLGSYKTKQDGMALMDNHTQAGPMDPHALGRKRAYTTPLNAL